MKVKIEQSAEIVSSLNTTIPLITTKVLNESDPRPIADHIASRDNPHEVTASQVGADPVGSADAVQTNLDTHTSDTTNPHAVTASQVGAYTSGEVDTLIDNTVEGLLNSAPENLDTLKELADALGNDENFSETVLNSLTEKALDSDLQSHIGDTDNPHSVTASQVGADPVGSADAVQTNLNSHTSDTNNPHSVTTSQIGAVDLTTNQTIGGVKNFSNNVGIGTSSPESKLHLVASQNTDGILFENSSTGASISAVGTTFRNDVGTSFFNFYSSNNLVNSDLNNQFYFKNEVGGVKFVAQASSSIGFGTGSTISDANDLWINSDGNVGIGTNSPENALSVKGSGFSVFDGTRGLKFFLDEGGDSGTRAGVFFDGNATTESEIGTGTDYGGLSYDDNQFIIANYNSGTTKDILFNQLDGSVRTSMIINSDGNVGIGTDTPSSPLSVSGSASGAINGVVNIHGEHGDAEYPLISLSKADSSTTYNPNGWGIGMGDSGQYNGYFYINRLGNNINQDFYITDRGQVISGNGFSVDDGVSFASSSSGSLAFWKPFDGSESLFSFRSPSGVNKTAKMNFQAYYYDTTLNSNSSVFTLTANNTGGHVGIGEETPLNSLDVSGGVVIGSSYSGTNTSPNNGLLVEGNVGIGTTSPGATLDVNGTISAISSQYPVLGFTRTTDSVTTGGDFDKIDGIYSAMRLETKTSQDMTDGFGGGIVFSLSDNTFDGAGSLGQQARIYARRDGADANGSLQFWVGNKAQTLGQTIRSDGKVGILESDPVAELDVNGNIQLQDNGNILWDNYTPYSGIFDMAIGINVDRDGITGLDFKNNSTTGQVRFMARADDNSYVVMNSPSSQMAGTWFGRNRKDSHYVWNAPGDGSGRDLVIGTLSENDLVFGTNDAERMMIDGTTGNVGIGTSSPNDLLVVKKNTSTDFTKIRVENDSTGTSCGASFELESDINNGYLSAIAHSSGRTLTRSGITLGGWTELLATTGTNGLLIDTQSDKPVVIGSNNIEVARFTSNGNVGIGTTTPDALLHLQSNTARIKLSDSNGVGVTIGDMVDTGSHNGVIMRSNTTNSQTLFYLMPNGSNTVASQFILTNEDDTTLTNYAGFSLANRNEYGLLKAFNVGSPSQQINKIAIELDAENSVTDEEFVVGINGLFSTGNPTELFKLNGDGAYFPNGNVGIGTTTPSEKLDVTGNANITGDLSVTGHFSAATKSFLIDNPETGGKLQYGVLEGNEHAVYYRGKTSESIIELPKEWSWLVDPDNVTTTVTPIGNFQPLFVISQDSDQVEIGGVEGEYNYVIYGTRKDVEPLEVDI